MDYVFITSISRLLAERKETAYNSGRICAAQTSEACCKYLLSRGIRPRIIIALCTKDAIEAKVSSDGGEVTVRSYDYFTQAITDYCCENGYAVPEFRMVRLLRRYERSNHFGAAVNAVYQIIREEASSQQTKILIDTAGGMRNISIMMQTMTRVLQYYGYQTSAYYTNFGEKRVFCDHTDRQIAIMEALAEFAQHGTVRKLRDCFRNNRIPEISSLLDAIQAFSDSIQLCRTQELPAIINERIFPLLDRIDNLKDTAVSQEDVAALRQMTDYIRIQFGYNPLMTAQEITPVDLIRWCLKNGLIQQAVTLFTESIPKYLVQTGLLRVEHPEAYPENGINSRETTWLYNNVIESCLQKETNETQKLLIHLEACLKGTAEPCSARVREITAYMHALSDKCGLEKPAEILENDHTKPRNETECMLREYVLQNDYRNYDKLRNALLTNQAFQLKLLGIEKNTDEDADREMKELRRKLKGIKAFSPEQLHETQPDFQVYLKENSTDHFRTFLMFYLYLKKRVRNYLNHASESNGLSIEFIPTFQEYGIITNDLTPDNIKENIDAALRHLNLCIPNQQYGDLL